MSATRQPKSKRRAVRRAATALWALLLSGCLFGGQTGGELTQGEKGESPNGGTPPSVPDPEPTVDASCTEQRTVIALAAPTHLGFTAADILAYTVGTHGAPLFWNPNPFPVTFEPEHGETWVEMVVQHDGGQARLVRSTPSTPPGAGSGPAIGCGPDRVEVDVRVRLTTSGGAFAEEFTATLSASSPMHARFSRPLAPNALGGTFRVTLPPTYLDPALNVEADFEPGLFSGSIYGAVDQQVGSDRDGSQAHISITYATWPNDRFPTPNSR